MKRHFTTTSSSHFFGKLAKSLENTRPKDLKQIQVVQPVGLSHVITPSVEIEKKGIFQSIKDFFDNDKRQIRQQELEAEMRNSSIHDLHFFNKFRGKMFKSPRSYFKAEKSLYFPNIVGETLSGERKCLKDFLGKVCIVKVHSTNQGEKVIAPVFNIADSTDNYLTSSGYKVFKQEFPEAEIVEINLIESGKNFLFQLSKKNLCKMIPDQRHSRYLIAPRNQLSEDMLKNLLMENLYSGYVYVVDREGRIRYLTCGAFDQAEYAMLWKSVRGVDRGEWLEEKDQKKYKQ